MSKCTCGSFAAETKRSKVARTTFCITSEGLCSACGDADRAVARYLAQHGPANGETFRYMRRAIGIPAKRLAELLGRTPEALSRWEHETQTIDPLAWALLGAIVLEDVAGRADTIARLDSMRKKTKPAKTVDVAAVKLATSSARHRAKRLQIIEAVAPFAWRRRKLKIGLGRPRSTETERPWRRIFLREPLPGEAPEASVITLEQGSKEEDEWYTQQNAVMCLERLKAIDERFATLGGARGSHFNVPECLIEVLRKGERDNGAITVASRLAWLAGVEREGEESWEQAEARVLRRYRRALLSSPSGRRFVEVIHDSFWEEVERDRMRGRARQFGDGTESDVSIDETPDTVH
jgi:hypothetical protein